MLIFILKRFGSGLVLIFIVTAMTFFLTHAASVPVAINLAGPNATAEQIATINAQLGLDRPIMEQYTSWMSGVFQGEFGRSYFSSEPVGEAMASRLPATLSVVVLAMLITLVVSVILGVLAASRRGFVDRIIQAISTISYVFPAIILGIVMVFIFAINLQWFPAVGYTPFSESPSEWLSSIILPATVLSVGGIASLSSQIRGSMIDELGKDYIRTLRSRGVSERSILLRHALRNASGPAFTTFSLLFISLFGAALFVEKIFALPGYGSYGYAATIQGDLPVMLGLTLFSVILVVVVNLTVDLVSGWLNPKARVS
ncbi:ABC transporter permease [Demequina muriae]|uniref:ABC transporter permease n=1 Tax=Demequina muriae TaxID=3051664 RepID=A0ABT8GG95_9MICO|nr:ABC transporter permease [Demequina sp. EGI L300058]MDN4480458.1 ABC transporter permease [Demequina sp. EGI L300058]